MKKKLISLLLLGLLMLCGANSLAANTKTTVTQVTATVELTTDVDYFVSSATPFGDDGVVNIVNTDHAVLILSSVKPSAALSLLAKHVQINGVKAVNNSNCQVKLYNRGCIILPYTDNVKPLTVYSEKNFEGESSNNFGLGNTGGYMNTLTDAQLNNKIRSFKLKRGYMVTFSNLPGGRGYSRCFIAADKDLEISELPVVMDQKISSYRVFKWFDTSKVGLAAAAGDNGACSALNVTSTYSWNEGTTMLPDIEVVPHQIYSGYPSAAACGGVNYSPHMKTTNEPRNTADDHPEDLTAILNNWESLMRTGMRLCSPSSWDGSDYWNGAGFLKEFFDSIDARGWRCDIIDLHGYWTEGSFNTNIPNWYNAVKRPVWISEWCWGASWNNNGAFANGATEEGLKTALKTICNTMNGQAYVERYFYWNGERDPSKVYKNGALTPGGEYYSTINSGVGYNGRYDYVPTTPKQYGPSKFVSMTTEDGKLQLQWYDANGEYNQLMEIQKKDNTGVWTTYEVVAQKESASNYTYTIDNPEEGVEYRLHVIDLSGKDYYSSEDIAVGDQIEVNGQMMYVGGNMFRNGDFNMGLLGWTNGKGEPLSAPLFQAVKKGGIGGGAYLQAYGNGDINAEGSVKMVVDVEKNATYYFRAGSLSGNAQMRLSLSSTGTAENNVKVNMKSTASWERFGATFNTSNYTKALLSFRQLLYKAQMDKIEMYRLYDTLEEALADGLEAAKHEAALAIAYNTAYPTLNTELTSVVDRYTEPTMESVNGVEKAIANQLKAVGYMATVDSLENVLSNTNKSECYGYEDMRALLNEAAKAESALTVINNVDEVKTLLATYLNFSNAEVQPLSPTFANPDSWQTKVGTYTGGDQRYNNKTPDSKPCWNAWWGLSATSNPTATMEVRQTVNELKEGIYTLECKATTEHYCTNDQHAYIKYEDKTVVSSNLTYDFFDLKVDNIWETLTTAPIYVKEGGSITIGFVGSKQGATDGQWKEKGSAKEPDNREGWWCATDFVLKYHPVVKLETTPNQFGLTCQPYNIAPSEGTQFYQIVGINPEYTQLCLEEVETSTAGQPVIYRSELSETPLLAWGEKVTKATDAPGNIKGYFYTSARIPQNYYYVVDGVWKKQTIASGNDRPNVPTYSGIMLPFTNKNWTALPVIENWAGAMMGIEGVTEDEIAANVAADIEVLKANSQQLKANGYYTLDGRKLKDTPRQGGLFIKVENGKARKVFVK